MIANTTGKGKTTEAIILSLLVQQGQSVLVPWGEERYDLALDHMSGFVRIQCKTGWLRDGCIEFNGVLARRPDDDLLHVAIRCVQQATLL